MPFPTRRVRPVKWIYHMLFQTLLEQIRVLSFKAFTFCAVSGEMFQSHIKKDIITLIPKPGKVTNSAKTWRPISI